MKMRRAGIPGVALCLTLLFGGSTVAGEMSARYRAELQQTIAKQNQRAIARQAARQRAAMRQTQSRRGSAGRCVKCGGPGGARDYVGKCRRCEGNSPDGAP